jgi:hypothetical protein
LAVGLLHTQSTNMKYWTLLTKQNHGLNSRDSNNYTDEESEVLNYPVFTNARMHLVQSTFRTNRSPSITLTVCRLGRKVRGVAFLDQGRLRPKVVFLPQCAHFAILHFPFQAMSVQLLDAQVNFFSRTVRLYKPGPDNSRTSLP